MNRVALVTGGASGIGLSVAQRLTADGATVIIADVDEPDASASDFVQIDLADPTACQALVPEVADRHGSIDILVNNAGFQHVSPIDTFDVDVWDKMLAVMLTAPFVLTKAALPAMRAAGWGRIVNMGSIHSLVASPFKAGYISAKHGLVGLTKTTALEAGADGITANVICPAYVRTPLVEQQIADQATAHGLSPEDVVADVMLEPAAIKRIIEPSEIAGVVTFLCSDAASSITGASWTVDLGWTAR